MNNNKFYNYDNNIEVLNEGFFDFVWKWTNRIFHSLFKVNDFSSLYKRVGQIEDLIKYGKVIKESNNVWKWVVSPTASGVAYIRVTAYNTTGTNMIVAVNEQIK